METRDGRATCLRIYLSEADRWHHRPLYMAVLELLLRSGIAGATAFRAVAGYGTHHRIHAVHLLDIAADLPIVIEAVDEPERIEAILPQLEEMVREGMLTLMPVDVRLYRTRSRGSPPPATG